MTQTLLEGQKDAWEEVEEIVIECQETESNRRKDELIQELLIRFEPFINMFYDLLVNEKTYLNNKVSRDFICLYIADKNLRNKIWKNKRLDKNEFNEVNRSLALVRDSYGKTDDVLHDLHFIFTQMVLTYKKTNRSFNTFISYVFKYRLFHFIDKFLRDRINNGYDRRAFEDAQLHSYSIRSHRDLDNEIMTDSQDNFNSAWINGTVCSKLFESLTPEERTIVARLFYENKRPIDVRRELNFSEAKYRKTRRNALEKLEKLTGLKTKHLRKTKASI